MFRSVGRSRDDDGLVSIVTSANAFRYCFRQIEHAMLVVTLVVTSVVTLIRLAADLDRAAACEGFCF